ncbi:MAG: hypothetical protein GC159_00210 [Phycisphaera sp.]|nr:hypothetical protein [Phycisphaera sp.]
MAGRGNTGLTMFLIFMVILFFVGTGLAIMFYSQLEEERKATTDLKYEYDLIVRENERNLPEVQRLKRLADIDKSTSVFSLLTADDAKLKSWINGKENMTMEEAAQALTNAGVNVGEGERVVTVISTAKGEADTAKAQSEVLKQQIAERQKELDALSQKYSTLQGEHQQRMQTLTTEIAKLKTDYEAYQQSVEKQQGDVAGTLKQRTEELTAEVGKREESIRALENEVSQLNVRIKKLQRDLRKDSLQAPDLTREGDGKIISVNPDDRLVYINLGRRDHMVLGMTFEVFEPLTGVKVTSEGDQLERGKASIEVVGIDETSSACRVVRSSLSASVLSGDLVANLVYDKSRTYKFYLFGEFDLDNDGVATLSDQDQVASLIRKWGGEIVEPRKRQQRLAALVGPEQAAQTVLPLDTDFLVIGQEPEIPDTGGPTDDPAVIRERIQAKKKWDEYIKLVNEARALSIPIINQHRFLALVGYYQR